MRLDPGVEIRELTLPDAIDESAEARDFVEMVRVRNLIEAATIGNDDLAIAPGELLPITKNPYETWRAFVAVVDDRIVGRAMYQVQGADDVRSAWISAEVLPEHRRRGIGSALFDVVVEVAHADGRSVLQADAYHLVGDDDGARLDSPTGFGSVPADDDAARFLTGRGFRLAQVDRMSRLTLPSGVGTPSPPEGYELLTWEGATPEEHLSDMAALNAKMSTDPPLGEVDWAPEQWDEARVRDSDARRAEDGRRYLTATVRHEASGRLVGFTDLAVPAEPERPVMQHDTIVDGEHRGHRLGMLLKRANLARLDEVAPGHPAIYTWNAEENRHMLDVNEAVGFVAFGYESSWRRDD